MLGRATGRVRGIIVQKATGTFVFITGTGALRKVPQDKYLEDCYRMDVVGKVLKNRSLRTVLWNGCL